MKMVTKTKPTDLSRLVLIVLVLVFINAFAVYPLSKVKNGVVGIPAQHIGDRISSCKEPKGVQVNKQLLEAVIGKYRRGEPVADGIFLCREAFPTLKKYALDPDPNVRGAITSHLRLYYSPEALQLLVRQIETYPSDASAFPAFYAAKSPCHFFRKIKVRSLTQVLTARIKSRDNDFQREEIYLLGCLAPKDPQARKFLEEMRQPSFPLRLSESDRQALLELSTYALAEDGLKEAEEKVLAEIEDATATGDFGTVQSALYKAKGFTNCRIVQRFARLILEKRAVSLEVLDEGKIKQRQVRIGDMAISTFTDLLGTQVTGEKDVEWKPHPDAEMERIYRRVKRALDSGKFSTCRSSK